MREQLSAVVPYTLPVVRELLPTVVPYAIFRDTAFARLFLIDFSAPTRYAARRLPIP